MDCAFRRWLEGGEDLSQLVSYLGRTPGGMFLFYPQDAFLDLEKQFVGVPIGCSGSILKTLQPRLLVSVVDLPTALKPISAASRKKPRKKHRY